MPRCWIVPGFLSCELYSDFERRHLVWVSYPTLMQGGVGYLRLAANGIDPGPPDGRQLFEGPPLADYWNTPINLLLDGLRPHGYRLDVLLYDWRKSITDAGQALANLIRDKDTASDPCSIVAHSMGGLVARAAWASLVLSGQESKVRRIVTLGSPHQGTYAPVSVLSGRYEALDQLEFVSYTLTSGINVLQWPIEFRRYNVPAIRDVAATWPALYSIFPVMGGSDAMNDPHRADLFERSNWPTSIPVQQTWLSYARAVFGPFLLSPTSQPPAWVLTTVAGQGVPTPAGLVRPELLGSAAAIGETQDGDGVVTGSSALMAESKRYVVSARHSDMPAYTAASGELAEWVLEVRDPITPVPPPETIPGVLTPVLAGPPIPQPLGVPPQAASCGGHKCPC